LRDVLAAGASFSGDAPLFLSDLFGYRPPITFYRDNPFIGASGRNFSGE
jgi:hypothetical protein